MIRQSAVIFSILFCFSHVASAETPASRLVKKLEKMEKNSEDIFVSKVIKEMGFKEVDGIGGGGGGVPFFKDGIQVNDTSEKNQSLYCESSLVARLEAKNERWNQLSPKEIAQNCLMVGVIIDRKTTTEILPIKFGHKKDKGKAVTTVVGPAGTHYLDASTGAKPEATTGDDQAGDKPHSAPAE